MIWSVLDFCRECNHSVSCHVGPFGREGNQFGNFRIVVWGKCTFMDRLLGKQICNCNKFAPKDNLKYLEYKYEQASH